MPSFGQKLKLEREKRAITLDQISSSTKIGSRMLQALEEDNFDLLPGGIFNKGFVRAYARCVGLDEEQTVADYLEASGQNVASIPDSAAEPAADPRENDSSDFPRPTPWGALAATLLAIAVALFLWSHWRHNKEESAQPSQPMAVLKPAPSTASEPASNPATTTPDLVAAPAKAINPPPKPPSSSSVVTAPDRPTAPGEFKVVILAREDSWLSIQIDNNPAFEDMLFADNQRAIHGRTQVVIKAGNVGGLDFVFDGNKLPSQGDLGEVKTLTFGAGGLHSNPPSPTPAR